MPQIQTFLLLTTSFVTVETADTGDGAGITGEADADD
jgi:hypothetical protein